MSIKALMQTILIQEHENKIIHTKVFEVLIWFNQNIGMVNQVI